MIRHPSNCNESSAIAAAILTAVPPSAFRLPPHVVKSLPRHLLERAAALADMHVALYEDAVAKRVIDRARMEECIGDYGRLRHRHSGLPRAGPGFGGPDAAARSSRRPPDRPAPRFTRKEDS